MSIKNINKKTLAAIAVIVFLIVVIAILSFARDNGVSTSADNNGVSVAGAATELENSMNLADKPQLCAGATAIIASASDEVSTTGSDMGMVASSADVVDVATACGYTNLGMSVIEEGNLNIRATASTDGKIVGKLTNHNAVELLETEGEWTKVTSGKVTGYVMSCYLATGDEAIAIAEEEVMDGAVVNTQTLRVRKEPNTDSKILSLVGDSEVLEVTKDLGDWVEVNVDDEVGYVSKEYVELIKYLTVAKTIEEIKYGAGVSEVRVNLVSYALQFVGNRYVWGGTSLTNGVDCSGFTMQILGHYGISLPHSSRAQPSCGTKINASDAKPGDLFFYGSGGSINHVAIYIGNGQIVHASNKRDGIKISNAFYRTPVCVVNYFD